MLIAAFCFGWLVIALATIGLAAPKSRAPIALRIIGALILLGGLLTPFLGTHLAAIIMGWWSQGPGIIRAWAIAAAILGAFIVYAAGPKRRAA